MLFFYSSLIETKEQLSKFEHIYKKYYGLMYHVAYSITCDNYHAEDVVHEVCLQIINSIDDVRIDSAKQLTSYLYIITRNRSIDYLRKWSHGQNVALEEDSACPATEGLDEVVLTKALLEQAVQQLSSMPGKYREPLTLKVSGYSIQEIAHSLGLSEGAVKTRIFRARQLLTQAFDD